MNAVTHARSIEKYLFDVNGYLVVEDALGPQLLKRLNAAVDECSEHVLPEDYDLALGAAAFVGEHKRTGFLDALGWPEPHGEAFRDLVALPAVLEHMLDLIGDGFRLDSVRGTVMSPGTEGFALHGGSGLVDTQCTYDVRDGHLRNGLITVGYALTDVAPGEGGFVCIPGSHKANFPCPDQLARLENGAEHVKQFAIRAGSAVVFTEALIHGTLPWLGDAPRRTVFVRYCPGALCFRTDPRPPGYESFADKLSALQQALMEPPYFNDRPSIAGLLQPASASASASG
jgi:Phytanoyl-CoA dioxygenase (PhyH)